MPALAGLGLMDILGSGVGRSSLGSAAPGRLLGTESLRANSNLGWGRVRARFFKSQRSTASLGRRPCSSATSLVDNAKRKRLFWEWLSWLRHPAVSSAPSPPHWLCGRPKEAFQTFQHFVFMKIPPHLFLATLFLWDIESHSQMEKLRNRATEGGFNQRLFQISQGPAGRVLRISNPVTNFHLKNTCGARL